MESGSSDAGGLMKVPLTTVYRPQKEERSPLTPQQQAARCLQPMKNPTALSSFLLSSVKASPSPLFSGRAYGSP